MAIEHADPEMEEAPAEEQSETLAVPASMLGGKEVAPGDVIRFEVVSVGDDGSPVVKYATEAEEVPGMKEMSEKFNPKKGY